MCKFAAPLDHNCHFLKFIGRALGETRLELSFKALFAHFRVQDDPQLIELGRVGALDEKSFFGSIGDEFQMGLGSKDDFICIVF